ncbi:hypothetical protein QR98_0080130 [Sarcoptes scabiei]|uniref:Uncharacterized protein n=1 Tax=Sarcoptes scabiei TaxID=52283 RepID=A0A132AER9_SARSC|nr:hypothetical protein QR98_0080130 [Sarcoptes scabiei]
MYLFIIKPIAFMRLTRRKYEVAYESSLQQQQTNPQTAAVSGSPHLPFHHQHQSVQGAHHNQPQLSSPQQQQLHQNTSSHNILAPHHHPSSHLGSQSQPHPFELFAKSIESKISPPNESSRNSSIHSPESVGSSNNGSTAVHPQRSSPSIPSSASSISAAAAAAAAAYQAHSLFAQQNPSNLLHSTLPFYTYHSSMPFPAGYPGFAGSTDSFFNGSVALPPMTSTSPPSSSGILNGQHHPKIWRSIDTEQLEGDNRSASNNETRSMEQSVRSDSNENSLEHCNESSDQAITSVADQQKQSSSIPNSEFYSHPISPTSSVHSYGSNRSCSKRKDDDLEDNHSGSPGRRIPDKIIEKNGIENVNERSESRISRHSYDDDEERDEMKPCETSRTDKEGGDVERDLEDGNNIDVVADDGDDIDVVSNGDLNNILQRQQTSQQTTLVNRTQGKSFKRHYVDVYRREEMMNRKRSIFSSSATLPISRNSSSSSSSSSSSEANNFNQYFPSTDHSTTTTTTTAINP